eukprot:GHVT01096700.1.p1 GENE.GHVT01096700.1~~GHVT01096700.1.p1  ORF type:complete len:422 (-),score=54.55 GHVT01096700.1:928-2193(-)
MGSRVRNSSAESVLLRLRCSGRTLPVDSCATSTRRRVTTCGPMTTNTDWAESEGGSSLGSSPDAGICRPRTAAPQQLLGNSVFFTPLRSLREDRSLEDSLLSDAFSRAIRLKDAHPPPAGKAPERLVNCSSQQATSPGPRDPVRRFSASMHRWFSSATAPPPGPFPASPPAAVELPYRSSVVHWQTPNQVPQHVQQMNSRRRLDPGNVQAVIAQPASRRMPVAQCTEKPPEHFSRAIASAARHPPAPICGCGRPHAPFPATGLPPQPRAPLLARTLDAATALVTLALRLAGGAAVLLILYAVYLAVASDVTAALSDEAHHFREKVAECKIQFHRNRCSTQRVPYMESHCRTWELCMRQPASDRSFVSLVTAQLFGKAVQAFADQLQWSTFVVVIIAVVLLLTFGSCFFSARRRWRASDRGS